MNIDFKTAVEDALIGFYVSTVSGKFIYANRHMLDIFGYETLDELKKLYIPEDIYASKKEREIFLNQLKAKGFIESIKIKVKKKNGNIIDIILSGRMTDEETLEGWIIDVTEHEQIKRENELFRRVMEENSDAIFITDYKGEIIYTNKKFKKIIGNVSDKLHVRSILPISSDVQSKLKNITYEIKNKGVWIGDLNIINNNNDIIPCAVKIFPLLDKKGRIENYINVFRDISEKKKLENQLKHAQKMELLGSMTGSIVHDLNNILTGISYNVELLRLIKSIANEKEEKYISNIEKSVDNGTALLRKILRFTRKTTVSKGPLLLSEVFEDIFSLTMPILKKHIKIKFNKEIKCAEKRIYGNKSSMVQVLLNLIVNAADAINDSEKKDGEILLTCESMLVKDKPCIRIVVSDNGGGIDPSLKEKIFEPFFSTKTDKTANENSGTGLGLSIVYREIKEMNGSIDFYTEVGKGTDFVILIPEYLSGKDEYVNYNNIKVETGDITNKKTIVIFDDDSYFRTSLVEVLKYYNFNAIPVTNKEEFLKIISEYNIDILLLDFVLENGENGEDILKLLLERNLNTPVFLMTGYIDSTIIGLKKYKNVKNILEKPVSGNEIVSRINNYFNI